MEHRILQVPSLTPNSFHHKFPYMFEFIKRGNRHYFKAYLKFDLSNSMLSFKEFTRFVQMTIRIRKEFDPYMEIIQDGTLIVYQSSPYMCLLPEDSERLKDDFELELAEFAMLIMKKIFCPYWIGRL